MLSLVTWDGGAGNMMWGNARNWSTDQLPGPDDDVLIDVPGDVTILLMGAIPHTVKSVTCHESLKNYAPGAGAAGSLTVTAPSVVERDLGSHRNECVPLRQWTECFLRGNRASGLRGHRT